MMAHSIDQRTIGGEAVHVGDCFIWAQIHYLDSPTDYREYIVKRIPRQSLPSRDGFITLDDSELFPCRAAVTIFARLWTVLSSVRWKFQRMPTA